MSPRSQGCSAVNESIATTKVSACDLTRIDSCRALTVSAMVRERLAERPADVTNSVPLLARVVLTGVAPAGDDIKVRDVAELTSARQSHSPALARTRMVVFCNGSCSCRAAETA
jgi:hypothetical protein